MLPKRVISCFLSIVKYITYVSKILKNDIIKWQLKAIVYVDENLKIINQFSFIFTAAKICGISVMKI